MRRAIGRRDLIASAAAAAAAWPAWAQPAQGVVRVDLKTGQGLISLELFADKAPLTTANFLRYLDDRLYDRATIYRALRTPGAEDTGLIQGGARFDPAKPHKPIAHESTLTTGLNHKDGTISLARGALGSARSDFFICVGESSYLDAHPDAPGDNQGFAAFGQVTVGMDVVRTILALPTSATKGPPGMVGQMIDPAVPILTARRV